MTPPKSDYTGNVIDGYTLTKRCGGGAIGAVYRAEISTDVNDVRAIKLIKKGDLRPHWQEEINKVTRIGGRADVIPYITHGEVNLEGEGFTWIAWRFIKGRSIEEVINDKGVTLPLLRDIIESILGVLHACAVSGIQHGDLHGGNVMIEDPNELDIDSSKNRVWITDFGYLTASQGKEMLDDYQGLNIIIRNALAVIDFHQLNGQEKYILREPRRRHQLLLLDSDPTEHAYVRNPQLLRQEFSNIFSHNPSGEQEGVKSVSDYLAAEILGENYDEWQALFVPDFIGADRLVERNTTVLTGLRGCGKTTVFRRLSAEMNLRLGETAQISGADGFVGFYFNARNIAEGFPWLPENKEEEAREQVTHFFHACWLIEIIDWLILSAEDDETFDWVFRRLRKYFGEDFIVTSSDSFGLRQVKSYLEIQRDLSKVGAEYSRGNWALSSITLLEEFSSEVISSKGLKDKPLYFFLDDYSTPLVTRTIQRILNAVVFRRGTSALFKIATESTESLEYVGLNGKTLELNDDFVLIDSAFESLQSSRKDKNRFLLEQILSRRILRDSSLRPYAKTLSDVIGETSESYNQLSRIRAGDLGKGKVVYAGKKVFCDIWSSNTREIIRLFSELFRAGNSADFKKLSEGGNPLIAPKLQNEVLKAAGSKYRDVLRAASNPTKNVWELPGAPREEAFGEHLVAIADGFSEIAIHELKTKLVKNGTSSAPKQARRIEITDANSSDLPEDLIPIYQGLIRYGVFLRDSRAKGARSKAVDRLVLRGVLIPYYVISLSKHDSISLSLVQFCEFLRKPKEFAANWKNSKEVESGEDPTLFDL